MEADLRSKDAFVMRWSQILLASSRGECPPKIAASLGCDSQTVRNAIHNVNKHGLGALELDSSHPKPTQVTFDKKSVEALREMLHCSPRDSLWTLEMAAEVSFEEGFTQRWVSGEAIRATLRAFSECVGNERNAAVLLLLLFLQIDTEHKH